MFVTISGTAASGKSTVAKLLAKKLGYEYVSMGMLSRKMAEEQGISLEELNRRSEEDPARDKEIDEYQRKLGESQDNMVVDGRMSFHFIPHSIKIYVDCALSERAKRIFHAQRSDEHFHSVGEAEQKLIERQHSDQLRYEKYYGVNCFDTSHYDLVLNSENTLPEALLEQILDFLTKQGVEVK